MTSIAARAGIAVTETCRSVAFCPTHRLRYKIANSISCRDEWNYEKIRSRAAGSSSGTPKGKKCAKTRVRSARGTASRPTACSSCRGQGHGRFERIHTSALFTASRESLRGAPRESTTA